MAKPPDYPVTILVELKVDGDTDPAVLGEKLLDFLAADPDDLFPEITVVNGYDYVLPED